jgi:hypothetical protein
MTDPTKSAAADAAGLAADYSARATYARGWEDASRQRDEVGIQLAAAQERLRLASVCVGVLRGALIGGGFTEHMRTVAREALRALDTVPGDALARSRALLTRERAAAIGAIQPIDTDDVKGGG